MVPYDKSGKGYQIWSFKFLCFRCSAVVLFIVYVVQIALKVLVMYVSTGPVTYIFEEDMVVMF